MKHGAAFRKLGRTSSHRNLMLRNLVTSLLQHEQIKTTLPKAREAARLAEKIITLGKKQDPKSYQKAQGFVLDPAILPKLFGFYAKRYADRSGGYTRIHKHGNRFGDNAPHAILELVDNPRDIKFEMTARAVGWEALRAKLQFGDLSNLVEKGVNDVDQLVKKELAMGPKTVGQLRPTTRWNLKKVMMFREPAQALQLGEKAQEHIDLILAKPVLMRTLLEDMGQKANKASAKDSDRLESTAQRGRDNFYRALPRAGQALPGETRSAIRLSQGTLGRSVPRVIPRAPRLARRHLPQNHLTFANVYGNPSA